MDNLLFERDECPFGRTWENWVATWYCWLVSIPKSESPCLDTTGKYCSVKQNDSNVWFLAGTFGNLAPIKRICAIPRGKAILLPLLVKEDSFAEDSDLRTESELIERARRATDKLLYVRASIDGKTIQCPEKYRVRSDVFDLFFPNNNIYDVKPGITSSVCDGFWLFVKPLPVGKHVIEFTGETAVTEQFTKEFMDRSEVYATLISQNEKKRNSRKIESFKVEVIYSLTIS